MKAVRIHQHGGPEVLRLEEVADPEPGRGEIRVRVAAAGVNFIDVYRRTGYYPVGDLPAILGGEGAGVVDRVGPAVAGVAEGDRVCFWDASGAYAQRVVLPAARAIPLGRSGPDERPMELHVAAALPLQGMTAHYLTRGIRPLASGDTVLIHAAAGGVGLLAVQMAKIAGATVFGTCSTEEKAERARAAGCDHVILYTREDFVAAVHRETGGVGVDLALDGVGRATFEDSVRATRVRGHVVLYGQASGEPEPVRPRKLLGSRTLTSASLADYAGDRDEMLARAEDVFRWFRERRLEVRVDRVLPLARAEEAHRALEGRETSGKVLLTPP
ncbi:MAG TPA: quinone oxidoreductase [Thermoanaerobaculia bacterium]|nr:quinone oxidoreductase [Thermoanaerobaculia bacterium]